MQNSQLMAGTGNSVLLAVWSLPFEFFSSFIQAANGVTFGDDL
jgi:hypothetical protein